MAEMRDMAGHELDPRVVEALILILDRAAAGT
jgi:HD-GYP domain-containing protein (c-di-GMP phosphodiesterase class II)